VTDCSGTPVSGLTLNITITKVNPNPPPAGFDETSVASTSAADTGTQMRWTGSPDYQYIYNLATKSLSDPTATYTLKISGPQIAAVTATFGLKT
jgi:hypothetical protein